MRAPGLKPWGSQAIVLSIPLPRKLLVLLIGSLWSLRRYDLFGAYCVLSEDIMGINLLPAVRDITIPSKEKRTVHAVPCCSDPH